MKNQIKSIFTIILFIFYAGLLFSQNTTAGLQIQVSNVKAVNGQIVVAVFNSDKTFLKESVICGLGYPVTSTDDMIVALPALPFGNYALSIYHDKNDNYELDTNLLGIPKEPYGFSNNARGSFGPPAYADAEFNFQMDGQVVSISLK